MALLDYENFGYETDLSYPNWWTVNGGFFSVSADGQGPFGIGRYVGTSTANEHGLSRSSWFANAQTVFIQGHVFCSGFGTSIWLLQDGAQPHLKLYYDLDGTFAIIHWNGTVLARTARSYPLNVWFFIQMKVLFSNSAGTVELRIEGVTRASATGVRTTWTSNQYANGWVCFGNNFRLANAVIYDNTGSQLNDFTKETIIYGAVPTGAGSNSGFTPSAGANWQNVDEIPADQDTTFNAAAAAPTTDTYAFPASVPPGAIVYAVGVEFDARKDDAGINTAAAVVKSGATTDVQGTFGLSTTYQRFRQFWETDPNTGLQWTQANAAAAEAGIRRIA